MDGERQLDAAADVVELDELEPEPDFESLDDLESLELDFSGDDVDFSDEPEEPDESELDDELDDELPAELLAASRLSVR